MITTNYLDPNAIEDVWSVNNRKENAGHIESLAESMRVHGYLPEYPMIVFNAESLAVITDKPYVMACGHHRRKAAILAKLDKVFCEIHAGTEDDWIEIMATDNFKFDVVSNPGIGLAFTEVERRAACRQLLLLPKYLEQTNVSLGEQWNVPESTVRRWRAEIEKQITEGTTMLEWTRQNVSLERLMRLKDVIKSDTRVTQEGEAVTVTRKPAVEDTEENRRQFWRKIDAAFDRNKFSDGKTFHERHGLNAYTLNEFCYMHFNCTYTTFPEEIPIRRLREVYNWVLTEDAEFIAECKAIEAELEAIEAAREKKRDALDDLKKTVIKKCSTAPKAPAWSDENKTCLKDFRIAVKAKYDGFDVDETYAKTVDENDTVTDLLQILKSDVESNQDWVQQFKKDHKQTLAGKRAKKEARWHKERNALIEALEKYPRNISERAFFTSLESHRYQDLGYLSESLSPEPLDDDDLDKQIRYFVEGKDALREKWDWVEKVPALDDDPESESQEPRITHLYIEAFDGEHAVKVKFDQHTAVEFIPGRMYQDVIKIAQKRQAYIDNGIDDESPDNDS